MKEQTVAEKIEYGVRLMRCGGENAAFDWASQQSPEILQAMVNEILRQIPHESDVIQRMSEAYRQKDAD